jgi:hypothetical protein
MVVENIYDLYLYFQIHTHSNLLLKIYGSVTECNITRMLHQYNFFILVRRWDGEAIINSQTQSGVIRDRTPVIDVRPNNFGIFCQLSYDFYTLHLYNLMSFIYITIFFMNIKYNYNFSSCYYSIFLMWQSFVLYIIVTIFFVGAIFFSKTKPLF